jgi:hypothetical protein
MKRQRLLPLVIMFFLLTATGAFAADLIPPLTVSFATDSITVSGVSSRATVYAFSLAREPQIGHNKIVPREVLLMENGAGQVVWTLPKPVPLRSIWFFVDLSTGAYGTGVPPGYPAVQVPFTDEHLKKDIGGDVDRFSLAATLAEFIVVRPGVGAWNSLVVYRDQVDQADDPHKITISVFDLKPALSNTEPAPKKLRKNDVVFLMDSFSATYGAARIGE